MTGLLPAPPPHATPPLQQTAKPVEQENRSYLIRLGGVHHFCMHAPKSPASIPGEGNPSRPPDLRPTRATIHGPCFLWKDRTFRCRCRFRHSHEFLPLCPGTLNSGPSNGNIWKPAVCVRTTPRSRSTGRYRQTGSYDSQRTFGPPQHLLITRSAFGRLSNREMQQREAA